jgi:hypothetical protein
MILSRRYLDPSFSLLFEPVALVEVSCAELILIDVV